MNAYFKKGIMECISVQEAAARLERGGSCLIDVRTPAEYGGAHATGATNLPLDLLAPEEIRKVAGDAGVMFICQKGGRSKKACEQLMARGMMGTVSVEGGTDAWRAAGLPAQIGVSVISLERQVRIAAGALVLLGTILGFVVSPLCFALPAFVGAGLVFAGVTDWCGMGLLLARLPWNR